MSVLTNKEKRKTIRRELYEALANDGVPIANCIKDLRRITGLNQAEFAAKTQVSLSALRRIEQGNGNFTMVTLTKILAPFDLDLVVKKKSASSS